MAWRLHETWWHLLLFAPLIAQVLKTGFGQTWRLHHSRPVLQGAVIFSAIAGLTMLVEGFGMPSTMALNWISCGLLTEVISRTGIKISAAN
ncbi:MAG: hypothetical protein V4532_04055 [Pseudomonadota bacterium]|uniref:hypothetical protein n=1 Tax=Aquabacterium sp. CECT 9606 TaxID=2845822 RepID=UPI001E3ADF21|nr:hypothetical protein [Aquabacterium sp. CECT 9606]